MLADVLYDMLDQLNAALMEIFKDELLKQNQAFFTVKKEGLDLKSGIFYELQDDTHIVRRQDNAGDNFFQLRLSTLYGYVLDLQQQDWTFYEYNVGVGNNNSITITQRTY
jgi:galactose-1-phosphate uridylyltransferase